ncbi:MAG: anthranilate synthase component I [Chthoniobacteraceae bacterium]|nr:anthranilate synthase component I [Chthoniobacteraceae bacterium]
MTTHLISPSREEFRALAQRGNLIPVSTELIADAETPISAFQKLDRGGYTFMLESAENSYEGGRYSFVGTDPRILFQARGKEVTVTEHGESRTYQAEGDPLHALEQLMARFRPVALPDLPRFAGGAVGYMAYDMVRFFEPTIGALPREKNPPNDVPDMVFLVTDTFLIFDHRLRRLRVLCNALVEGDADTAYDIACEKIEALMERLARPAFLPPVNIHTSVAPQEARSNTTREEFYKMVRDGREYIQAGDIFQVVFSQRFETDYDGDPLQIYRALRYINPSPYLFCFKFGDAFALVGSSPEVHVRAIEGNITIRPIAGTRKRGATPEEDAANATELLADPKEKAEHLMLVDLARNDVGRVCEFGTVRVTDFMTIERYSHVMHIVSNVVGKLRPGANAYDVLRATFPAGTVSGSPKVRAMQIINQEEKSRRGAYAGAVGYFGFDGNHDSCITLRSVLLKDGKAFVQAGGGNVADSTPEGEYQETVNKAMAVMRAIEHAKGISNAPCQH